MDNSLQAIKIKEGFIGQRMITIPPNIKAEILKNELIKDFYTTAIGYYPHANYHDRKRKTGSNEYILLYCVEGSGEIDLADARYILQPNTYIIIPPGVRHHYRSSKKNPWTLFWAHIVGKNADLLYRKYNGIYDSPIVSIPRSERSQKNFMKIMNILESGYGTTGLEYANLILFHIVTQMVYQMATDTPEAKTDIITNSITFMNNNLDKNYKVEDLAAEQNLSVSRYSELFKKKTGYSPIQYFNKLKIEKSCQYLYFTDLGIKEICAKIGHSDPYYYSRAFKSLMGIPPSKYRRLYQTSKKPKA